MVLAFHLPVRTGAVRKNIIFLRASPQWAEHADGYCQVTRTSPIWKFW